jgi:hypothetical protein
MERGAGRRKRYKWKCDKVVRSSWVQESVVEVKI